MITIKLSDRKKKPQTTELTYAAGGKSDEFSLLADEGIGENPEVNVTEERQDRIADSVHKTSILERLKEQKQQEQTGEIQQKPKKKHEQEL